MTNDHHYPYDDIHCKLIECVMLIRWYRQSTSIEQWITFVIVIVNVIVIVVVVVVVVVVVEVVVEVVLVVVVVVVIVVVIPSLVPNQSTLLLTCL